MKGASWIFLWIALAGFLTAGACGKKEPPSLPRKETVFLQVVNLEGRRTDGKALLKGEILGLGESVQARDHVVGARVYFAHYPPDGIPCAGCPIDYQGYHILGPEVVTETGFECRVPAEAKGEVYFFEVVLLGREGPLGPSSYRVRVPAE